MNKLANQPAMITINCIINHRPHQFHLHPGTSLLELLRNEGFISVKEGCGVGECGACTVLVDGEAIDSCLYLAIWVEGKKVETCENELIKGKPSFIQQAYINHHAIQCGFCTPGFIMSTRALVNKMNNSHTACCLDRKDIRYELAGNFCRCTGYQSIIDAVEEILEQTTVNNPNNQE